MAACKTASSSNTRNGWYNETESFTWMQQFKLRRRGSIPTNKWNSMNARITITILTCTICLGSVWAVLGQRQQLAKLRLEREKAVSGSSSTPSTSDSGALTGDSQTATDAPPGGT